MEAETRSTKRLGMRSFAVPLLAVALGLVLPPRSSGQVCPDCEYRRFAPGIAGVELADPQGLWSAEGLEIDLFDPLVAVETAIAERSVLGRETIGQIALRRKESRRWLVALVGCDFPARRGLPRGLLVQNGGLLSPPSGNPSLIITPDGFPAIATLHWAMSLELSGGHHIPIQHFNRHPQSGEVALFSPHFADTTGTSGDVTELELHLFDAYLNPTGETRVRVGDVFPRLSNQAIPRYGFILALPHDLYRKYANRLAIGVKAKIQCRLTGNDIPDRIRRELTVPDGDPGWPSRIAWAVSGGPRIVRDARISLETEKEAIPPEMIGQGDSKTVLGLHPGSGRLWIVVVKAREAGRVSLLDAARCLILLGATEGMALAGGDHSPLRIRDRVLNPPVSSKIEVPIANALLLYSRSEPPALARLDVEPGPLVFLPTHGEVEFTVSAYDESGWKIPVDPQQVEVEKQSELGRLDEKKFTAGRREGRIDLVFRLAASFGAAYIDTSRPITVDVRHPRRLVIIPSPIILDPGDRIDLTADLVDGRGTSLHFPKNKVEWKLEGCDGVVSPDGVLICSSTGSGWVVGGYRGWKGKAPVYAGLLRSFVLDDMTDPGQWDTDHQLMAGANCTLSPLQGSVGGHHAATLRYTLPDTDGASVILNRRLPVGGKPYAFRMRVSGDQSGHNLRCLVEDRFGDLFRVGFRKPITWGESWRTLDAPLALAEPDSAQSSSHLRFPITVVGIMLARGPDRPAGSGTIGLGPLEVLYLDR